MAFFNPGTLYPQPNPNADIPTAPESPVLDASSSSRMTDPTDQTTTMNATSTKTTSIGQAKFTASKAKTIHSPIEKLNPMIEAIKTEIDNGNNLVAAVKNVVGNRFYQSSTRHKCYRNPDLINHAINKCGESGIPTKLLKKIDWDDSEIVFDTELCMALIRVFPQAIDNFPYVNKNIDLFLKAVNINPLVVLNTRNYQLVYQKRTVELLAQKGYGDLLEKLHPNHISKVLSTLRTFDRAENDTNIPLAVINLLRGNINVIVKWQDNGYDEDQKAHELSRMTNHIFDNPDFIENLISLDPKAVVASFGHHPLRDDWHTMKALINEGFILEAFRNMSDRLRNEKETLDYLFAKYPNFNLEKIFPENSAEENARLREYHLKRVNFLLSFGMAYASHRTKLDKPDAEHLPRGNTGPLDEDDNPTSNSLDRIVTAPLGKAAIKQLSPLVFSYL